MTPEIFQLVVNDVGCQTIFGVNPTRFYSFGQAQKGVAKPYAVWQTIGGEPENTLSCLPTSDRYSIQIDVYATTAKDARDGARALRDAFEVEQFCSIQGWRGEEKEFDTGLFRYSFDVDFWQDR